MIRMIQVKSVAHAEDYFDDALSKTGYYINGQEHAGEFQGKCSDRLGVSGPATKRLFRDLCNNKNPQTKQTLTQRTIQNRTVYYDINFHCPKSVSIAYAIHEDDNILSAFRDSVQETMLDIEADAQTRIRKNGEQNQNRKTGELIWADFVHLTARPVDSDSVPDPHLHCHCTTFNVTWDQEEQLYKAGQFRDIKRDMPYYQERYYKRLSDSLLALGYGIRRTKNSFEIDGISQDLIDLFSKRTKEINRFAKENNITNEKSLDQLGSRTRSKKKKDISLNDLKSEWRKQIKEHGLDTILNRTHPTNSQTHGLSLTARHCVDHALKQCFERASVAQDRRILATAYRHSLGINNLSQNSITSCFKQDKRILIIKDGLKSMCTTQDVLLEEKRMVDLANAGKGRLLPIYSTLPSLSVMGDQAAAVAHILTTTDIVSNVQGGAGTGKTTTLKELVHHIHNAKIKTTLIAPTANASRTVLREEGFPEADTVARLLIDSDMQNGLQNGALIVDEAGLLGVKEMTALLQLATDKNARLILFGDTRQHASVLRGDALRILNTVAGIKAAEINKIYRQRHECYRKAVEDIASGDIHSAFKRLDQFGAIVEADSEDLVPLLVEDYMEVVQNRKSALVVSPTHHQGDIVTAEIRKALKRENLIGSDDRHITRYINLNFTEAEKTDLRLYELGYVVQFNQNLQGIQRGSLWKIESQSSNSVIIQDDRGREMELPTHKAHQFTVYRKTTIPIAIGDTVTITRGSFDRNGKRLNNGQSLKICSFDEQGNIILINPTSKIQYVLSNDFGHINHGYTTTSHAAQGKTVDTVLIAQPASTFAASNMKQFYVSVSRARDNVRIYTDDKESLLAQVSESGDRQSAHELIGMETLVPHMNEQCPISRPIRPNPKPLTEKPNQPTRGETRHYAPKPVF